MGTLCYGIDNHNIYNCPLLTMILVVYVIKNGGNVRCVLWCTTGHWRTLQTGTQHWPWMMCKGCVTKMATTDSLWCQGRSSPGMRLQSYLKPAKLPGNIAAAEVDKRRKSWRAHVHNLVDMHRISGISHMMLLLLVLHLPAILSQPPLCICTNAQPAISKTTWPRSTISFLLTTVNSEIQMLAQPQMPNCRKKIFQAASPLCTSQMSDGLMCSSQRWEEQQDGYWTFPTSFPRFLLQQLTSGPPNL